ncbi:EpsG family protein [Klebsiella oxytoca]|uniref:EpsG family protein n=1 Tax=Klebsiella oxytoca TaxID=571 RepID=UPI00157A6021|nr:EpsG family protein [Klebsiella oxytoca]
MFNLENKNKMCGYVFIFTLIIFSAIFSPLTGFYISIAFLVSFNIEDRQTRFLITIVCLVSASLMNASRFVGYDAADDFYNIYYPVFEKISNGGGVFDTNFSGGVEFGLPLYFKIVYLLFGRVSPNELLIALVFSMSILYYFYLEKFLLPNIDAEKRSLCLGFAFLFINYFDQTQLVRQMFATVFILYAVSFFYQRKYCSLFCSLFLGSIFHLSSIPIFFVFIALFSGNKKIQILLVLLLLMCSFFFLVIVKYVLSTNLLSVASYKFDFYASNQNNEAFDVGSLKLFIVACIASFFFSSKDYVKYKYFLVFGTLCYISLAPILFASNRVLMPMTGYFMGVLIFFSIYKISNIFRLLLILYCIFRFMKLGPLYSPGADSSVLLWHQWPWLGSVFL